MLLLTLAAPAAAQKETETVDRTVTIGDRGRLNLKNFSGDVRITGTSLATSPPNGSSSAPRRTSTARMPARRAPSTSCPTLSPTITASAGATPSSCRHASKMLGFGFRKPCCDEETAALIIGGCLIASRAKPKLAEPIEAAAV